MNENNSNMNRRQMLKYLGAGTLFIGAGGILGKVNTFARSESHLTQRTTVSISKGNDCRDITFQALMQIEDEIMTSLEGKKRILVKPNMVHTSKPLCATSVESIKGILDFLKPRWKGPVVVGESTANQEGTWAGFKNYGYLPLEKEYGITLKDLNEGPHIMRYAIGAGNAPLPVPILTTFLDRDQYIISAAKMKTHDRVLATLSLKNILLAAPWNQYKNMNFKRHMHQTQDRSRDSILHYNMFSLAQEIYPDLGVIDGFEAMEGNGPVGGTPVDMRVAMASTDPLALDTVAMKSMGFDPSQILYLSSLGESGKGAYTMDKIQVKGYSLDNFYYRFKASDRMERIYGI